MDIERATTTVKTMKTQLAPYASYIPEVSQLDPIIADLEAKNAAAALEKVKKFRSAMERYMSMAPDRIKPLIDAVDSVIKDLT